MCQSFSNIRDLLIRHFGDGVVLGEETVGLQSALLIEPKQIVDVCLFLRNHQELYFDSLSCLSGVDGGAENNLLGVVYHLYSVPYGHQLVLKIWVDVDRNSSFLPEVSSVSSVWRTAEWHEREVYDLLGVFFSNHPDLRRILLPDDWEGYPLRKDYKPAETYHGIRIESTITH